MKFVVGIDEVGRGPLAGPVSVGVVVSTSEIVMEGLADSKKMTEKARERIYEEAIELKKQGSLGFEVFSVPATEIDARGIELAISSCIIRGLEKLAPDSSLVEVYLDGRLKAPKEYKQETITHGDYLIPIISLASVVAKVSRDRYMSEVVHPRFPEYGFNRHKGYGTAFHTRAIKQNGVCSEHRKSFLSNILPVGHEASKIQG